MDKPCCYVPRVISYENLFCVNFMQLLRPVKIICTSVSAAVLNLSCSRSVLMASACGTPDVMRCKVVLIGVARLLLYILINNQDNNLQCFEKHLLLIIQLSKTVGVFVNALQCIKSLCKFCNFGHICNWNDKSHSLLVPFLFFETSPILLEQYCTVSARLETFKEN